MCDSDPSAEESHVATETRRQVSRNDPPPKYRARPAGSITNGPNPNFLAPNIREYESIFQHAFRFAFRVGIRVCVKKHNEGKRPVVPIKIDAILATQSHTSKINRQRSIDTN